MYEDHKIIMYWCQKYTMNVKFEEYKEGDCIVSHPLNIEKCLAHRCNGVNDLGMKCFYFNGSRRPISDK